MLAVVYVGAQLACVAGAILRDPAHQQDIADRANRVLDGWNQDKNGYDEVYGDGGSSRMRS